MLWLAMPVRDGSHTGEQACRLSGAGGHDGRRQSGGAIRRRDKLIRSPNCNLQLQPNPEGVQAEPVGRRGSSCGP